MNMQKEVQSSGSHPRLDGVFNILIGIFLLLVAYGLLLYASAIYPTPCGAGTLGVCTPQPYTPFVLAPLYIFIGVGSVLGLYSLKMIVKGMVSMTAPRNKPFMTPSSSPATSTTAEKIEVRKQKAPMPTTPVQEQKVLSTKIEKCAFCSTELPLAATYCPKCFQKRNI